MVTEDDKNSSQHIIQVDQGGLSLPNKDYYLKNDTDSKKVRESLLFSSDRLPPERRNLA